MPSNFTANYSLSQWERTDKIQMEDFNDDNAKIDGALGEHAAALSAQAAQIAKRGNCMFHHGTYTGSGLGGPVSYTFPWVPQLVIIVGDASLAVMPYGDARCRNLYGTTPTDLAVTWSGNSISWQLASGTTRNPYLHMNQQNTVYHVYAFAMKS